MSYILASLFSRISSSAGLLVYNVDKSHAHYLQLIDFSKLPTHLRQIRGICIHGEQLFALTPSSFLIFNISNQSKGPLFILHKTICRPEWLLGDNQQADLHAIYVCKKTNLIYISFNAQCAIDVFDTNGNFIYRKFLWEIMPESNTQLDSSIKFPFRFGVVRHIFENGNNELFLTIAQINGTEKSAVIGYSSGKKLLDAKDNPLHGGFIRDDILYLCAIQKEKVLAFHYPKKSDTFFELNFNPLFQFSPQITDSKWENSDQKTRGIVLLNDRLFCGVCFFGKPMTGQVSPRIVEFDLNSGEQIKEHWLPSYKGFEQPHIYSMISTSEKFEDLLSLREKPSFYIGNFEDSGMWKPQEVLPDSNEKSSSDFTQQFNDNKSSSIYLSRIEISPESNNEKFFSIGIPNRSTHNYGTIAIPNILADEKHSSSNSYNSLLATPVSKFINCDKPATVVFENVGLCFERAARRFLSFNRTLRRKKAFWALRDISFTVHEGETLGVIGRNGSGKSTLSLLLAKVLIPDYGKVIVNGRSQLLALGVGFKVELSGRENVYINGSLLGLSKHEIKSKMDEIISFSELGDYIDEPVRTYSSGMRSRLGFAVATAVQPDILILDEILAVGDQAFKDKAMKRMEKMHGLARSVIVVSHNPSQLRKLASRILWIEKGRILLLDTPDHVVKAYNEFCNNPAEWFKQNPVLARKVFQKEGINE
jgi:ABC-type polysaccharide/polyol phosphate transport system ATPase subunit